MRNMERDRIEQIEVELLVEAVFRRYGHDFRHYARSHLMRRFKQLAGKWKLGRLSELLPPILHDETAFESMLQELSVTVTTMFRDPPVYRRIRETVLPILRTYPFVRVWVAGCATGEEAYSLAIVFKEAGMYDRTTIYATDFNDTALEKARSGVFALDGIRSYSENYRLSGGTRSFADYYYATGDGAMLDPALKDNIVFANHNLAVDGIFSEVHLILCRNVLIYFNRRLQERVFSLFNESLVHNGFLCLGEFEEIIAAYSGLYRRMDRKSRLFQLIGHK